MCHMQGIALNGNQIGDVGMQAFSTALAGGALAKCQKLILGENVIGDAGMEAFASACASGNSAAAASPSAGNALPAAAIF